MAQQVTYTCKQCRRPGTATMPAIFEMVERNRARCSYCGGGLEFPPPVQQAIDNRHSYGGHDLRAPTEYKCPSCPQSITKPLQDVVKMILNKKSRCPLHGVELQFPPHVQQIAGGVQQRAPSMREKLKFPCPTCTRDNFSNPGIPEMALTCGYCGAKFRAPLAPDQPARPPALEIPPAGVEEVQAVTGGLPKQGIGGVVGWALAARAARQEVTIAEAVVLAARLPAVMAWRPSGSEDPPFLPVPQDEAERLVPALLFGGQQSLADRSHPEDVDLVFSAGESSKILSADNAINALSAVSVMLGGAGVFTLGGEKQKKEHRLRVTLSPREDPDGVALSMASQVDSGRPKPVPAKVLADFSQQLAALRKSLISYYVLLALFGPWAAGTPVVVAPAAAIEKRFVELGLGPDQARTWAQSLQIL